VQICRKIHFSNSQSFSLLGGVCWLINAYMYCEITYKPSGANLMLQDYLAIDGQR
jgi:hypothetical protein